MTHQYNAAAVEREIDRERRRSGVSKREAKTIHALLKGWRGDSRTDNPYPETKPRLRAAWQRGFDAFGSTFHHYEANPYKWGTPCRAAFLGGWERGRVVNAAVALPKHCDDCDFTTTDPDVHRCPDQLCRGNVG